MAEKYCSVRFRTGEELDTALAAALSACDEAEKAKACADRAEAATLKNPYIQDDTWWVYDCEQQKYVDTGVVATPAYPDLGENDPNHPSYIKNRTHWKEVFGVDGVIIPVTTARFNQGGLASVVGVADGLVEGGKYFINLGGAEFEGRCKKAYDGWYVGNGNLIFDELESTNDGWCIYSPGGTRYNIFLRNSQGGSVKVTMRGIQETTWHKLDSGYLPEPVALALGDYGIDLEAIVNAGGSAVVENTSLLWSKVADAWQAGNRLRVSIPVGDTELCVSDPMIWKVDDAGLCLLMNTALVMDTSLVSLYIMLSPEVNDGEVNTAKTTVYAKSVLLG